MFIQALLFLFYIYFNSITSPMEECDDLKIPLKDVMLATNNFAHNKRIGWGGFGTVYIGELSRPEGLITVACKRLDPKFWQGDVEFQNEIRILSKYKHENLVTLLHFCIGVMRGSLCTSMQLVGASIAI
ncbi:putative protein kinase RLK-Pelle-LRR-Xb-1 family [Helianthus debilis subsp. tardiflorus]